eukprot:261373_1
MSGLHEKRDQYRPNVSITGGIIYGNPHFGGHQSSNSNSYQYEFQQNEQMHSHSQSHAMDYDAHNQTIKNRKSCHLLRDIAPKQSRSTNNNTKPRDRRWSIEANMDSNEFRETQITNTKRERRHAQMIRPHMNQRKRNFTERDDNEINDIYSQNNHNYQQIRDRHHRNRNRGDNDKYIVDNKNERYSNRYYDRNERHDKRRDNDRHRTRDNDRHKRVRDNSRGRERKRSRSRNNRRKSKRNRNNMTGRDENTVLIENWINVRKTCPLLSVNDIQCLVEAQIAP